MTLKESYIRTYGKKEFERLSPRIKKIAREIDSLAINKKPVTKKQLQRVLA